MLSIYDDVVGIVQSKFTSSEIVRTIHLNVSLVDEQWDDAFRLIALVQHDESFALFVFLSKNQKPTGISDLTIETVIPVDHYFNCDTKLIPGCQSHLILIIKFQKAKLDFKIEIGTESSIFASELIQSKETGDKVTDFGWLEKYSNSEMEDEPADFMRAKNPAQSQLNRESMLRYQLKRKEPEYTYQDTFTIFIGTWNVNGQPPTVPLGSWLGCDPEPPDLYAVGFQEIDLSKEAFLFNDTPRETEWLDFVLKGVHDKAKYKLVAAVRLVGMFLVVLVNVKHYQFVKNVMVDTVGTGLLGKMGNKGGVGVRFELHSTSLCFVNCHLAAHLDEFERRNQDYKDINARMNFRKAPQSIKGHDHIYWFGDLNYRINGLSTTEVKTLIANKDLYNLLKLDQLCQQKELGRVLLDYMEGDITFQPTYKYNLNSDVYDTSEKARPPAWTDRILHRGTGIYQKAYRSHMEIRMSDHKPVSGLFKADINVIDQAKYRKVHEDLLKRMDKSENEHLPHVTIDQTEIVFDLVKFQQAQSRDIIVANTGQVPAEFEFIKKLNETNYCKDWLRIMPNCGVIDPGQKADLTFEVFLESDADKIEDILVLHLKGGKDMFITVSAECEKSSFTASMEVLCRVSVPILRASDDMWTAAQNDGSKVLFSIPREVWFMVDHLYRYGLKTRDLFESNALHEELVRIRDWLNQGSLDNMPGSVAAVAESLLIFLSYTKQPVVPFELQDACIASASNFQNCKAIIARMSQVHKNVFLYICMFLQEMLNYSSENGYDAKTLALLFADILMRDPIRNSKPQANRGKSNFIYNFLVNDLSSLIVPK